LGLEKIGHGRKKEDSVGVQGVNFEVSIVRTLMVNMAIVKSESSKFQTKFLQVFAVW
jgi:hypothetical protein